MSVSWRIACLFCIAAGTRLREKLEASEGRRDAAIGAERRTEMDYQVTAAQVVVEEMDAKIGGLERREDTAFQRHREQLHAKRYAKPQVEQLFEDGNSSSNDHRRGRTRSCSRFLHTADWHLGKRFSKFKDEAKLTRARCDVLERIFGAAEKHDVDAVLCAGDLFDEPNPLPEWWQPLVQCLVKQGPQNRPVVLLPGNHDPLLPDSVWAAGHAFRKALPSWSSRRRPRQLRTRASW